MAVRREEEEEEGEERPRLLPGGTSNRAVRRFWEAQSFLSSLRCSRAAGKALSWFCRTFTSRNLRAAPTRPLESERAGVRAATIWHQTHLALNSTHTRFQRHTHGRIATTPRTPRKRQSVACGWVVFVGGARHARDPPNLAIGFDPMWRNSFWMLSAKNGIGTGRPPRPPRSPVPISK